NTGCAVGCIDENASVPVRDLGERLFCLFPANTQNHDVLFRCFFSGAGFGLRADTASKLYQRIWSFAVTENDFVSVPNEMFGVGLCQVSCSDKSEFHLRILFD